jgi:hypothetical protein
MCAVSSSPLFAVNTRDYLLSWPAVNWFCSGREGGRSEPARSGSRGSGRARYSSRFPLCAGLPVHRTRRVADHGELRQLQVSTFSLCCAAASGPLSWLPDVSFVPLKYGERVWERTGYAGCRRACATRGGSRLGTHRRYAGLPDTMRSFYFRNQLRSHLNTQLRL